jgi:hypothetical protein
MNTRCLNAENNTKEIKTMAATGKCMTRKRFQEIELKAPAREQRRCLHMNWISVHIFQMLKHLSSENEVDLKRAHARAKVWIRQDFDGEDVADGVVQGR